MARLITWIQQMEYCIKRCRD